jgi:hypothetical protein
MFSLRMLEIVAFALYSSHATAAPFPNWQSSQNHVSICHQHSWRWRDQPQLPERWFLAVTYMFMYDITMFSGHVFECPTSFSVISQPTSFHGPAVLCHTAIDECLIQVLSFWAFATSKLGYPLLQCLRAFRFSSVFHSADRVFVIIERNWNGSAEQCWRKSSNYKTRHL